MDKSKINNPEPTFMILQKVIVEQYKNRPDGSKWQLLFSMSNIVLIGLAIIGSASIIEICIAANAPLAALATVLFIIFTVTLFMMKQNTSWIMSRLLLVYFLGFFAYIFFGAESGNVPIFWSFTFILMAFTSVGYREGLYWIAAHAAIVFSALYTGHGREAGLMTPQQWRLLVYSYALVVFLSYILDYTARIVASQSEIQNKSLAESSARYEILLNSVGEGLIATDANGIIEYVNEQAIKILGITRQDLMRQPYTAVIREETGEGSNIVHTNRLLTQVLSSGFAVTVNQTNKERIMMVKGDHGKFPVAMTVTPVKVAGQVLGAIVLFHDMSSEDQMDRAKSEFVSLASHQLRTPLNVIAWYVEKLKSQKKGPLNERQADYLTEVEVSNRRMINLVTDLLNMSRVELGSIKLNHEKVELVGLLKSLEKEIDPLFKQKNITYVPTIDVESITLHNSDMNIMTVVLQNLLSNAAKYTRENGTVNVAVHTVNASDVLIPDKLSASEPGIVISVQDNGIGIPDNQKDKIFTKLFRAENVQSLAVNGTGLGLYVTQSFVRSLGGEIWFDSVMDEGTTFYVYLPYGTEQNINASAQPVMVTAEEFKH